MKPETLKRLKLIKENVVVKYQATLYELKKSSYSRNMPAKTLASAYVKTLDLLDAELANFNSRDGNYIILMSDKLLEQKLENELSRIANKFLMQVMPIVNGMYKIQIIEEELLLNSDIAMLSIMDDVAKGAAIAYFEPGVLDK